MQSNYRPDPLGGRRFHLTGDLSGVIFGGPLETSCPQPTSAPPDPAGPEYTRRFDLVACRFVLALARVNKRLAARTRHPADPPSPGRMRAEERYEVALTRYDAVEAELATLIRGLTWGLPVALPAWQVDPDEVPNCYATIAWGGMIFRLSHSGRRVRVQPAHLFMRMGDR